MFLNPLMDEVFQEQAEPFRLVRPALTVCPSKLLLSHLNLAGAQLYLLVAGLTLVLLFLFNINTNSLTI